MKESNLLASAALFSELYNDENYKNISDIIAEFIKGAVLYTGNYSFNSTELTALLEKVYEFQIPESVIRTTLNNKLKNEVQRIDGYYHFDKDIINQLQNINQDYKAIIENQNQIFENLISFVENKENRKLDEAAKKELFENFTHFLLDNGFSDTFSNLISAYVILNEKNNDFRNSLNVIREGIILYQGIKFTADINELGKWTTDITLYLNTEHLFNALGYNGVLFQEIFKDFLILVNEINLSNTQTQRKKIELRYFDETKKEVDNFFLTAETIKKGLKRLDPSKSAMKTILADCESSSDIKKKRVKFDLDLKHMGIKLQDFDVELVKIARYNVEDEKSLDELRKIALSNGRVFDESLCLQYFKIFTKINYFRKGESNRPFERIGHLFMTENGFAKYLAHHNLVKFGDDDISFAKDIDFIITRFWFKLKKGFSNKQSLPRSFDVVTKARIILSSHINNSISEEYQKLVNETKSGKLSQEEALERSYEFREKPNRPEDITLENVDDSLNFLTNESYFEDIFREKVRKDNLLSETQKKYEELANEIKKRDQIEKEKAEQLARNAYVLSSWKEKRLNNWKDLGCIVIVILTNLLLALFAEQMSVNVEFKKWLNLGTAYQYIIIAIYLIIVVVEIIGRSYLFNKEKLKNGWNWLIILISQSKHNQYYSDFKTATETDFDNIQGK